MCLQICDIGNSSVIIINGDDVYLPKWGTHFHAHGCLKRQDMVIFPPQIYKVAKRLSDKSLIFKHTPLVC